MNWLFWLVVILLAGLTIWGHYRGFFKMAVGLLALVIAVAGTVIIGPPIAGAVRNSKISETVEEKFNDFVEKNITGNLDEMVKSMQDQSIEELPLPGILRDVLKKNNTLDKYKEMGVSSFRMYLCRFLATMVIYAMVYLVLFLLLLIGTHVVFYFLDFVAKLPVLHGANQLAGAAIGLCQALLYTWLFFLIITAFSSKGWAATSLAMVKDSQFLSLIYDNNLLLTTIMNFL